MSQMMSYLLFSFVVYLEKLSAPTLYIVKCNGVTEVHRDI